MRMFLFAAAAAAALGVAPGAALADVTGTVTMTIAPNGFGSPSTPGWVDNSIHAQINGLSSFGTPGTPTYYQAQDSILATQFVATGFNSWLGVADPPAPYNFELGVRALGGIRLDGGGQVFSISQLSAILDSDDPADLLDFTFAQGGYNYSNDYRGVLAGGDMTLWTADDVFITSGPNTQGVHALVGRGSGSVPAAYCPPAPAVCDTAAKQASIADATSYFNQFAVTNFSVTYLLDGNVVGSGNLEILGAGAVPEPATWAMMILGFGAVGSLVRRRRHGLAAA